MNHNLIGVLDCANKRAETWTSTDGSELLILPYGGRILGLFAPASDRNFLWIHPALDKADTAQAFFRSADWHNTGGDRTWVAPEIDFFFPDFPQLETYWEPRELDPGDFRVSQEDEGFALVNRFSLRASRSRHSVDLVLSKRIAPALNPLRHFKPSLLGRVDYAGYTLATTLGFASGRPEPSMVGIWNLLQLPHGGDLLIPTLSRTTIDMYMGEIDANDLVSTEHLIRYKMRASGKHKFGIQALTAIGRVGSLRFSEDRAYLVIRNFFVDPSGEYVDVSWTNLGSSASVIQACNIDCELGRYSELEYHAPAIGGKTDVSSCQDVSQVWAFSGKKDDVLAAARILISADA
jgi:hypothetical protein